MPSPLSRRARRHHSAYRRPEALSACPPPGRRRETMGKGAVIFPGQGSQSVGMGQDLAAASPAAAAVFAAADAALGEPISRLAWEGPEEDLNRTENAQPALLPPPL